MRKILIVDDEQSVHQAIRSLVDWSQFYADTPLSAYNGQEALALLETLRPDVVFIDMEMPLMDGKTFLAKATAAHPEIQYIVVSGYDSFNFTQAAIRCKAVDYLLKPIDRAELLEALRQACSRLPAPEEPRRPADIALVLKSYVDHHYREDISLAKLSEMFFFSREYLNRVFRAAYGCAVYEYVQRVRMEHAARLLRDPGQSIQSVADGLGYSNANYFSKAFKKYYGMSPSEFREQGEGRAASPPGE